MGPIQPAGQGASHTASSSLRAGDLAPRPGAGASRGSAAAPSASGRTGAAASVTRIDTAVTQLLQSVGGGVENDKLLQLMIALLILLTMLGHQQEQQAESHNTWRGFGSGNTGTSSFAGLYSSTTSVSVEQSYTSGILTDGYSAPASGGDAQPVQLDEVA